MAGAMQRCLLLSLVAGLRRDEVRSQHLSNASMLRAPDFDALTRFPNHDGEVGTMLRFVPWDEQAVASIGRNATGFPQERWTLDYAIILWRGTGFLGTLTTSYHAFMLLGFRDGQHKIPNVWITERSGTDPSLEAEGGHLPSIAGSKIYEPFLLCREVETIGSCFERLQMPCPNNNFNVDKISTTNEWFVRAEFYGVEPQSPVKDVLDDNCEYITPLARTSSTYKLVETDRPDDPKDWVTYGLPNRGDNDVYGFVSCGGVLEPGLTWGVIEKRRLDNIRRQSLLLVHQMDHLVNSTDPEDKVPWLPSGFSEGTKANVLAMMKSRFDTLGERATFEERVGMVMESHFHSWNPFTCNCQHYTTLMIRSILPQSVKSRTSRRLFALLQQDASSVIETYVDWVVFAVSGMFLRATMFWDPLCFEADEASGPPPHTVLANVQKFGQDFRKGVETSAADAQITIAELVKGVTEVDRQPNVDISNAERTSAHAHPAEFDPELDADDLWDYQPPRTTSDSETDDVEAEGLQMDRERTTSDSETDDVEAEWLQMDRDRTTYWL